MKNYSKVLLTGVIATTLTACSGMGYFGQDRDQEHTGHKHEGGLHDYFKSEQPVRHKGTEFDYFLYEGYRALAKKEDFEHDLDDREKFLSRAMRSSQGLLVSPEEIRVRDLPEEHVQELVDARQRLEDAFYAGASINMPKEAATAQVKFDCWMEQQEEDIQQHDIDECKLGFMDAMARIDGGKKMPPAHKHEGPTYTHSHDHEHTHGPNSCVDHTHEPEKQEEMACPLPKKAAPAKDVVVYRGPYIIYFDLDKDVITSDARRILDQVVVDAARMGPKHIVVTGHTDTSGNKAHNEDLSKRRVANAAGVLRSEGVDVRVIEASHYGERKQRIHTGDGVRHSGNRRVEIDFEW